MAVESSDAYSMLCSTCKMSSIIVNHRCTCMLSCAALLLRLTGYSFRLGIMALNDTNTFAHKLQQ